MKPQLQTIAPLLVAEAARQQSQRPSDFDAPPLTINRYSVTEIERDLFALSPRHKSRYIPLTRKARGF